MADTTLKTEPTVLGAVWRFRWFVVFLVLAFAALGWLYASQTSQWTAEATLSVQDPRATNLFDQAQSDSPERYVDSQVAIIRSRAVAKRAVEIAAEQTPPIIVTVDEVIENLSVSAAPASDIVTLAYTAPTQREAIGVVNAVAAAYQDIGRQTADENFADAVAELDTSIADLQDDIATVEEQLAARQRAVLDQLESDPNRIAKQTLRDELVAQLLALTPPLPTAEDTVIAAFTLALAAGAEFREAVELANIAGGIVVMKMGTATVGREELEAAIEDRP